MADFEYDDRNLQRMIDELDAKHRVKVLKGAFRIAGNKIKKTAIMNLRQSISSNKTLEKGVKVKVWKRTAGFRVTVGDGFYKSKRFTGYSAREVPVLRWLDTGTKGRKTKKKLRFFKGGKKSHSTGRLKSYGYMSRTLNQEESSVTAYLQDAVVKSVTRISKKYGCK